MKRFFQLALALGFFSLTACAQQNKQHSDKMNNPKTLVAYFSATGTTAAVAQRVATVTGATLYEIKPVQPYTDADLDWTNKQSRSTVEMKDKQSRPAIVKNLEDADSYDTIFIGFPIWWYTAPTIINTFIDTYGFKGKRVALFATSGGSTPAKAMKELQATYPEVHFVGSRLLNGATEEEIKAWTNGLK